MLGRRSDFLGASGLAGGVWQKAPSQPAASAPSHGFGGSTMLQVVGSGDNQVVFTLAGLGAPVTSVDISGRQTCPSTSIK